MLEQDDLKWEVSERGLYLSSGQKVDSHKAIVRADSEWSQDAIVLGVHSKRYEPVQNAEVRDFADLIVQESGGTIRGSWSLKDGAVMGIQVEGGTFLVPGDPSEYSDFMVIGNSHNGTLPFVAHPTQVRIICRNTFYAALSRVGAEKTAHGKKDTNVDALGIRLRHTSSIHDKIEQAKKAISLQYAERANFIAWAEELQTKWASFDTFVNTLIPDIESELDSAHQAVADAREVLRQVNRRSTQTGIRGNNAYGVLNAGIEYLDHFEDPKRKTKTAEGNKLLRTVGFSPDKTNRLNAALRASLA